MKEIIITAQIRKEIGLIFQSDEILKVFYKFETNKEEGYIKSESQVTFQTWDWCFVRFLALMGISSVAMAYYLMSLSI